MMYSICIAKKNTIFAFDMETMAFVSACLLKTSVKL